MAARILIADDQSDILEALRLLLKGEGFETTAVTSPVRSGARSKRATSTWSCST